MSFTTPVMFRMNIEGLGEQIAGAIAVHAAEMQDAVREGAKQAAENLDMVAIARAEAEKAMADAIKRSVEEFFRWGQGYEMVKRVMRTVEEMDAE